MQRLTRHAPAVVAAISLGLALAPWPTGTAVEPAVDVPIQQPMPAVIVARLTAKRQLAREVAAGTRSLFETAALFAALNQLPPALPEASPMHTNDLVPLPTRTPEERLCWQVASWVNGLDTDRRRGPSPAVLRLAEEVRSELRAHGTLRLPELRPGELAAVLGPTAVH